MGIRFMFKTLKKHEQYVLEGKGNQLTVQCPGEVLEHIQPKI